MNLDPQGYGIFINFIGEDLVKDLDWVLINMIFIPKPDFGITAFDTT